MSNVLEPQNVASPSRSRMKPDNLSEQEPTNGQANRSAAFVWGAGVECSFIPHLSIDQFEWTQHDQFWREDFRRAREELGLSALRYALPWHKIEREPGRFDWAAADERVEGACKQGLALYLDVMHFGTPLWLRQAVGDPEFPEALERFTFALVNRYRDSVHHWTPCNEPLVLSLFSGDFGFWPPHSRKWIGYMPVLSRVMQATSRSIRAIRQADPRATVLLCDNVENYKTRVPELQTEVEQRNQRRFLAMDLLLGRVDRAHRLFSWVTRYGLSEIDLEWFAMHPQSPDILGIDYYPNSEWQLDKSGQGVFQRRSETPLGLYGIARIYYQRYGLPMMLTETSSDGKAINREIWLEQTIEDCRRLREEGIPMLGYFWWPMIDQLDWDGALTHRIGKIHDVGIYNLERQPDGRLQRKVTPLVEQFARHIRNGTASIGELAPMIAPATDGDGAFIGEPVEGESAAVQAPTRAGAASNALDNANGAATISPHPAAPAAASADSIDVQSVRLPGIVVFSHLRWGFVWQRPQQFLSRFARRHKVLFVEEPLFDLPESAEPRLSFHRVMPNVTVLAPHVSPDWRSSRRLPQLLRKFTTEGIEALNENGDFDAPLLWYYSPMDSAWSLGYFRNSGVIYDCMDELSHFTGAPPALQRNEARLMQYADVVFAGGYELGEKKRAQHSNVHTFGCGVDVAHFSKAMDPATRIPPDIDFMKRPILGWFGVIDERVDYTLLAEIARMRQDWSFAMLGPVVKVDPNLLPHAPNLFWLGGRDYDQLPHYCRAFDVNMMCFAINRATEFINPTKGLEYMATGRPIVSTPIRDVVRQWSDIVRLAATPAEFVKAAEEALRAGPEDERIKRGIALARNNSWDVTVSTMQKLIREAIANPSRHSARAIEPLSESELESSYIATPGS